MVQEKSSIRVALVGVGNCASSLVQGVRFYRDADAGTTVPGLMNVRFGRYPVGDVQFVEAFDVDAKKVGQELPAASVHVGPSDWVPWQEDCKWAYVRPEGQSSGGVPLNLEYKLEAWDSPNSAGVIIDAVSAAKVALDRGLSGLIEPVCAYLMTSPPVQMSACRAVEAFAGEPL